MDLRAIVFVLGNLLMLLGVALLAPFGVALVADSHSPEVHALAFTAAGAVAVGMAARTLWRKHAAHIRVREGFAVVVLAWLMACVVGMIPYLAAGAITSVTDAFFETMSGFTTTGASILPRVEVLPPGLLFWRSMTQWLGGGGIVVLSVAIMPLLGAAGYHVLKAETTGGVVFERERPRIAETAKELWLIYLGMTALLIVLLRLCGMSTYDAFCHAFATVATGGFSTHTESVAFFPSPVLQWVVIAFMLMGATNFVLYSQIFRGRFRAVLHNPELRLYAAVLLLCVAAGMWVAPVDGFEPRLRAVAFSVASVSTTTGFTTHDFDTWPQIMRALLVCLMIAGGSMGSTAGGLKIARLIVFAKTMARELYRFISPHAVQAIRVGERVLEPQQVANILVFGAAYSAALVLGALVMTACGYEITTALSASASALGNVGPGLGAVGPAAHWGHLPDVAKWVMSGLMLVGRLEVYAVLVLLTPWAWRR